MAEPLKDLQPPEIEGALLEKMALRIEERLKAKARRKLAALGLGLTGAALAAAWLLLPRTLETTAQPAQTAETADAVEPPDVEPSVAREGSLRIAREGVRALRLEGEGSARISLDADASWSATLEETSVRFQRVVFDVAANRTEIRFELVSGTLELTHPSAEGAETLRAGDVRRFPRGDAELSEDDSSEEDAAERDSTEDEGPRSARRRARPQSPADEPGERIRVDAFEEAQVARRQGDFGRAARLLSAFVSNSPDDPRAPLASLTAGRIYMDQLGQRAAARQRFQWNLQNDRSSLRREVALARLVELTPAPQCLRLRERYERDFPAGASLRRVRAACPDSDPP
ncbi:MAG: hypothetical protein AAF411_07455 [Myxococcota bacterium]